MSLSDYDSERGWTPASASSWDSASVADRAMGAKDQELESNNIRVEYMDITEKERSYGDRPIILPTSAFNQAKDVDKKYTDYALLLRRKVDKDGNRLGTALEIWSPIIRKALKENLAECSYLNLIACPIVIKQPYHVLFHYRSEIRLFATDPERTVEEKKHLELLTTFMDNNLFRFEREYDQFIPNRLTTFQLLWTLFRPETIVVLHTPNFKECYRVNQVGDDIKNGELVFKISTWSWDYNGSLFGPTKSQHYIQQFEGVRSITELNAYPLWALPEDEREELENQLKIRGRKWRDFVDNSHKQYSGPAWVPLVEGIGSSIDDLMPLHVDGRIFLDYKSHQENNYGLSTILYTQSGVIQPKRQKRDAPYYLPSPPLPPTEPRVLADDIRVLNSMKCYDNTQEYEMTDYQALLCPARIRGFALGEKRWAFFLLDEVKEINWSDVAFNQLELDQEVKDKIQALVECHYTENNLGDFVAKKGKGLVLLLHGRPGTGKTLTAESIAEYTHRPLYYIGAGELGMDVGTTERKLQKIFDMAKSWGAILLLDEADVFLAKRTSDDMVRNGFVSVFLRLLEYYEGIIFLTTNRIEEFDPAFQSRVHMRIAYGDLDSKKRANIWRNVLHRIEACQNWDTAVFEKLGQEIDVNGREINNLVRTALAISTRRKSALTVDSLMSMYKLNFSQPTLMGTAAIESDTDESSKL